MFMTDSFLFQISRNWRIAEDELQWILQRCKNLKQYTSERDHSENWRGRSFCRTRKTLIRCIREHVTLEPGEGDDLIEAAVARVERFPEMHVARPEPLRGVGRRQSRGDEVGGADRDEAGVWREGGRGRRPHSS